MFCAGRGVEGCGVGVGEGVSLICFLFVGGMLGVGEGWKGEGLWGEGGGMLWLGMLDADIAILYRSLVYVEGDASMNKFTAKDGTPQSALSIVQREFVLFFTLSLGGKVGTAYRGRCIGNFEILDRRDARAEGLVEGEGA